MLNCEKCWDDAGIRASTTGKTKMDCYHELLNERKNNPCTPKEQAGQFWDKEKQCDKRITNKQCPYCKGLRRQVWECIDCGQVT